MLFNKLQYYKFMFYHYDFIKVFTINFSINNYFVFHTLNYNVNYQKIESKGYRIHYLLFYVLVQIYINNLS